MSRAGWPSVADELRQFFAFVLTFVVFVPVLRVLH